MLSEDILDELARSSPLQEALVSLAWPSLSTESRLQLVQAIQSGPAPSTPDWLLDLALQDVAPIVRFWAARHAYLPESLPDNPLIPSIAPAEEDVARWAAVRADPEPLISACATCETFFWPPEKLIAQPQSSRLLTIRRMTSPDFSAFVDWIEMALSADVADEELQQCIHEFFTLPGLKEALELPEAEQEPYGAYSRERALEKAWELTKLAGPRTQRTLAFALPLQVGRHGRVKTDLLVSLPGPVVEALLFRTGGNDMEFLCEVREKISANLETFPPEVHKALSREAETLVLVNHERLRRHDLMGSPTIGKATLKELFDVTDRLAKIEEAIAEFQREVRGKKGLVW